MCIFMVLVLVSYIDPGYNKYMITLHKFDF